jgi:hypothetical protein
MSKVIDEFFSFIEGCVTLLVIGVLVALAATKPDEAAHRAAFAERTPITRAVFAVQEVLGNAELQYHDYILFSVMTARLEKNGPEVPVSYGYLGKVHYGKEK